MSGIYIPGLSVPEDKTIAVIVHSDGTAYTTRIFAGVCSGYLKDYVVIPIPDHGRLIDADALFKKARYRMGITPGGIDEVEAFIRVADLLDAPTIIPADKEGEG